MCGFGWRIVCVCISSSCFLLFGHCSSCGSCSIPLDLSGYDSGLHVHLSALHNRKTHAVQRHRWCFRKSTRRLEANRLLVSQECVGQRQRGSRYPIHRNSPRIFRGWAKYDCFAVRGMSSRREAPQTAAQRAKSIVQIDFRHRTPGNGSGYA